MIIFDIHQIWPANGTKCEKKRKEKQQLLIVSYQFTPGEYASLFVGVAELHHLLHLGGDHGGLLGRPGHHHPSAVQERESE